MVQHVVRQLMSTPLILGMLLACAEFPVTANTLQLERQFSLKERAPWILAQSTADVYDQLDRAVKAQNWDQALAIVEQLIQLDPDRRRELQAYRDQLEALATAAASALSDLTADSFDDIQQQLQTCVLQQASSLSEPDQLLQISQTCTIEVLTQFPDGRPRPDIEDRLKTLLRATGTSLPRRRGTGQSRLNLMPIENTRLFTLPVSLGSLTEPFLLDTGATNTVIARELADQLNLQQTPIPSTLLAMGAVGDDCPDEGTAAMHPLPSVTLGSSQVSNLLGLSLPNAFIPAQQSGALGIDFLSAYDVVLNPAVPSLELLPPTRLDPNGIPLKAELGLITTEIYINDQGPFKLGLDTGAEVMVISTSIKETLSLSSGRPEEVIGFCGITTSELVQLEQVRILSHQVSQLDAVVLDNLTLELMGVDGLVGQNFLSEFQQHWRFAPLDDLGFLDRGSLTLTELK